MVVGEADIRRTVSIEDAIPAVEEGFTRLVRGEVSLPPMISLEIRESKGEAHVKGAHIAGAASFAIKVTTGFYDNPLIGLPRGGGMMLVFSARTGCPEALLLDNGYLTEVRTAAAGAIAAKYLAKAKLSTVGVVGAGAQERFQIMALPRVRDFDRALVHDVNPSRLEQ